MDSTVLNMNINICTNTQFIDFQVQVKPSWSKQTSVPAKHSCTRMVDLKKKSLLTLFVILYRHLSIFTLKVGSIYLHLTFYRTILYHKPFLHKGKNDWNHAPRCPPNVFVYMITNVYNSTKLIPSYINVVCSISTLDHSDHQTFRRD